MQEGPNPFRKPHKPEENQEAWLMSYADMITLLLCFFVIFVSTSEPREDKLAAATRGMQARFGSVDLSTPFQGAFRAIQGVIEKYAANQDVSVEKVEKSLQIEISTTKFFVSDSAELNVASVPMLAEMTEGLKNKEFDKYDIIIEGHSDDSQPAEGGFYATNWELSAARAVRMIRFFEDQNFKPERMRAVVYADTKPKAPNVDKDGNPIEGNRERNRRIVIRLERTF